MGDGSTFWRSGGEGLKWALESWGSPGHRGENKAGRCALGEHVRPLCECLPGLAQGQVLTGGERHASLWDTSGTKGSQTCPVPASPLESGVMRCTYLTLGLAPYCSKQSRLFALWYSAARWMGAPVHGCITGKQAKRLCHDPTCPLPRQCCNTPCPNTLAHANRGP